MVFTTMAPVRVAMVLEKNLGINDVILLERPARIFSFFTGVFRARRATLWGLMPVLLVPATSWNSVLVVTVTRAHA